jgi:YHS domain-containing protein
MLTTLLLAALTATAPSSGSAKAAPTNTICPVLGHDVTPGKSPVVTVRGRSYYICCTGCDTKLAKNPDLYLGKDGMPRNAKAKSPVDPSTHRH